MISIVKCVVHVVLMYQAHRVYVIYTFGNMARAASEVLRWTESFYCALVK